MDCLALWEILLYLCTHLFRKWFACYSGVSAFDYLSSFCWSFFFFLGAGGCLSAVYFCLIAERFDNRGLVTKYMLFGGTFKFNHLLLIPLLTFLSEMLVNVISCMWYWSSITFSNYEYLFSNRHLWGAFLIFKELVLYSVTVTNGVLAADCSTLKLLQLPTPLSLRPLLLLQRKLILAGWKMRIVFSLTCMGCMTPFSKVPWSAVIGIEPRT